MKIKLLSPFEDGEPIWIGLDTPGMRRRSRLVSPSIGSTEFMAGVTIFEPGESSSMHVHDESEEINIVLGGGGRSSRRGRSASSATASGCGSARHVPSAQEHGQRAASVGVDLHAAGRPPVVVTAAAGRDSNAPANATSGARTT